MGNSNSWGKDSTFHELVILASVDKLDNLRGIFIKMSFIVIINSDLSVWELETADVNPCGVRVVLEEIDESRQVVSQVF